MVTTDTFHDWHLPERIARLKDLAYNLWWSWHPEARVLFKEVDRSLWAETHHNPVQLLRRCPPERIKFLQADPAFLARYDAVIATFDQYMSTADTWFAKSHPEMKGQSVGYFSAEFGVHNSLRIYSGGLGGRSLQGGVRSRRAARWRRLYVSPGLRPAKNFFRWLAAKRL
jgi:starch phosphorylase